MNFESQNVGDEIRFPTTEERHHYESAESTIKGIATGWRRLQPHIKENQILWVTMKTANNEILVVGRIVPESHSSFSAEGYIGDKPAIIAGHISTLSLSCTIEEKAIVGTKKGIGFMPTITENLAVKDK